MTTSMLGLVPYSLCFPNAILSVTKQPNPPKSLVVSFVAERPFVAGKKLLTAFTLNSMQQEIGYNNVYFGGKMINNPKVFGTVAPTALPLNGGHFNLEVSFF